MIGVMSDDGPRLIPNALGDLLTPSVVGIDESGQVLVGRTAREYQVRHPDRCAATFKRHMGSEWTTQLGNQTLGAVELSSLVLQSLKADAEAALREPVQRAVITVPAYFNEPQRKATIRAGELAGLQVTRVLNEPTAAAIAYGVHQMADDQVLLVYDLGGGTFDVSIVERFEGTLEIRASAGEIFLGGEDFTSALIARILESQGLVFERAEQEQPLLVARLRHDCELAKRQLTKQPTATVRIPARDGQVTADATPVTISREDFDKWTASILQRTDGPLRRALGDAKLTRADLDDIILVGGATRMPGVRQRIQEMFQREPKCALNPDEVVAIGATIQSGLITSHHSVEDVVVTDVSPFTLGIETSHEQGHRRREGYFLPIINRNTTIPVSRSEVVGTVNANQTEIRFKLYQGEHRRVEENVFLGEFMVSGIPLGPPGQEVEIRFTYDLNGILEAEATIVKTKKSVTHVVTKFAKGLSKAEIDRAVAAMQKLKLHPREETQNRYLLRLAERVFSELPVEQRNILDQLLRGFEDALELHEPSAIELYRTMLAEFLQQFEETEDGGEDYAT